MKELNPLQRIVLCADLLLNFAIAITTYTNSSYIENSVGQGTVGILYALSAILTIVVLSNATRVLAKEGNRKYFFFYGTLQIVSLIALILPFSNFIHILAFITYLLSVNVLIFSLDIFFEGSSGSRNKGKMRGIFLMLGNVGFLFAPVISAIVIDRFSYVGTYTLALIAFIFTILILKFGLKKYKDSEYHVTHKPFESLNKVFKEKIIRSVVISNFVLQFFYVWMIVYTPIYLHTHLNFEWDTIGVMFSFMILAFVLLDYPLGKIADAIGSEKELTVIGFCIMLISVLGIGMVSTPNAYIVGILLFFSRVGAATVEAMTEIHFFKTIREEDKNLISIFRDLRPLAYIIAPVFGTLIISFTPFKTIFFVLGLIITVGIISAFYIEKKRKWWIREHKD